MHQQLQQPLLPVVSVVVVEVAQEVVDDTGVGGREVETVGCSRSSVASARSEAIEEECWGGFGFVWVGTGKCFQHMLAHGRRRACVSLSGVVGRTLIVK